MCIIPGRAGKLTARGRKRTEPEGMSVPWPVPFYCRWGSADLHPGFARSMKIVAVTASPTRLAAVRMAAEALRAAAGWGRYVEAGDFDRILRPSSRREGTLSAVDRGRSASLLGGCSAEDGRRAVAT